MVNLSIAAHSVGLVNFLGHLDNFHYILCVGSNPDSFEKPKISHRAILNAITLALGLVANVIQMREREKLTKLQATRTAGEYIPLVIDTRSFVSTLERISGGLPRTGPVHPGLHYLKIQGLFVVCLFLGQIPFILFMQQLRAGTNNEFPNRLNPFLMQLIPGALWSILMPILMARSEKGYGRRLRGLIKSSANKITPLE